MLNRLRAMWPVCIKPDIDGISIVYDSKKECFRYRKKTYSIKLGKRTYRPIFGYLIVSQINLEKINYKRMQNNLEIFKNAWQAVLWILEDKKYLHMLTFIAHSLVNEKGHFIEGESRLLKTLGYKTIDDYFPATPQEADNFLKRFSLCQTQKERSECFTASDEIKFSTVEVCGALDSFMFFNNNLAIKPTIKSKYSFADANGNIMTRYMFDPIKILSHTFTTVTVPFEALLDSVTLVDNKVHALWEREMSSCEYCPTCDTKLENNKCLNYYCKEKVIKRAHHIASKLEIRGLSLNTLSMIYDCIVNTSQAPSGHISDVFFFYTDKELINALGFKDAQSRLLYQSLCKSKTRQKFTAIINAVKIPGLDKKRAKIIGRLCNNDIDKFVNAMKANTTSKELNEKLKTLQEIKNLVNEIA